MRELLAGLVPGLPDAAVPAIVARADGIPLYAVETVRTLVADGRLELERRRLRAGRRPRRRLAVPETLTALIAARLDALDEADRSLVHDAAVLGQTFTLGGAGGRVRAAEPEPRATAAGLVRRELLRPRLDARSPERGQYAFVQALIREVAYNTLSHKDRKTRHLAAARYFERSDRTSSPARSPATTSPRTRTPTEGPEADALAAQARIALRAAAERRRVSRRPRPGGLLPRAGALGDD